MKKKLAAFLCGAMMATSAFAFASVAPDKIMLGSLSPGMAVSDLVEKCGQPNYKRGDNWVYDKFTAEIDENRPGFVEKITTRNGAFSTPNGVSVGQSAEVLNSTFGKADDVDVERNSVEYEYFSTDHMKKIEFKVINGVITKISCSVID